VIAEMKLAFVRPARIDDALMVRTRYDSVKGPRLMISQIIERDGEALCRADVIAVCIHLDGRPRRPTRALVDAVTPWLAPKAPGPE
jgi:acyl-CoA thioester hydrolase